MTQLSRRQLQVFNFVTKFIKEKDYAPTLSEICQGVGLNQDIEASRYLSILVEKKYLERVPGARRQIRIVKYPDNPAMSAESAAYARGVAAGRAQLLGASAPDGHALRQAYNRGFREGHREANEKLPKDAQEAFERGAIFGRKELQEELTFMQAQANIETPPAGVPPRVLPFLRSSD